MERAYRRTEGLKSKLQAASVIGLNCTFLKAFVGEKITSQNLEGIREALKSLEECAFPG